MISTAVNSNTAVEFPYVTPVKGVDEKSAGQDFMKILSQERERAQQADAMSDKADTGTKMEDVQEPEYDNDVQEEHDKADPVEDAEENTAVEERATEEATTAQETQQEPTDDMPDEETMEAVEEALKKILQQMQDQLGMSEEEILGAVEELGFSIMDLLNPENMAQLVITLGGQDSTIHLVTDEMMYQDVQELTAFVEEQAQQLMEETNMTPEDMEALMNKLKELEQAAMAEAGVEDGEEVTVTVEGDENQQMKLSENQEQATEAVKEADKEQAANENGAQEGESNFQKQQSEMMEYQNKMEAAQGTTKAFDYAKAGSADMESILRQLTDHVKIQHGQELTEMELQLHPASLGTINVQLTTRGGVVTAELTTQNEAVKNAIEAQVAQLKANLEEQGVKVEAIEVSVASHQMERNLDQSGDNQQHQEAERTESIQGIRRRSINLNELEGAEALTEGELVEDEATRLAVEMMTMNGNSMDLLA